MKKKNIWLIIGVIIAIVLLMVWLFVGTTLEEVTNPETAPIEIESNWKLEIENWKLGLVAINFQFSISNY